MESTTMERKFFDNVMTNLSINFRQRLDKKQTDLFWEHCKKSSPEQFKIAINDLIEAEQYFPTVATIKKYLQNPTKSGKHDSSQRHKNDGLCEYCHKQTPIEGMEYCRQCTDYFIANPKNNIWGDSILKHIELWMEISTKTD